MSLRFPESSLDSEFMNWGHTDNLPFLAWCDLFLTGHLSWLTFQYFTLKFFHKFSVDAVVSWIFICDRFANE